MIVFRHAWGLPGAADPMAEPIVHTLGFISAGGLGVATLFFLSGLLVSQSWANSHDPMDFAARRVARIWPGLIVCLIVTVLVIAPLNAIERAGWLARRDLPAYVVDNALLFHLRFDLPGVFDDHRFRAINGSLWTLAAEVTMYGLVLGLGCLGLLRARVSTVVVCIAAGVTLWVWRPASAALNASPELVRGMLYFLAGMVAHALRDRLRFGLRPALILWALFAASFTLAPLRLAEPVFHAAWAITLLTVGTQTAIARRLALPVDPSYGVYLYGFPLQQTMVGLLPASSALLNLMLSLPLALACGVLSWRFVERPMLRLNARIAGGRTSHGWRHSLAALAFSVALPGSLVALAALLARH